MINGVLGAEDGTDHGRGTVLQALITELDALEDALDSFASPLSPNASFRIPASQAKKSHSQRLSVSPSQFRVSHAATAPNAVDAYD